MKTELRIHPRCVVFDLDDTLYLERDYVKSGFLHVGGHIRRKFGVEGFTETAWRLFLTGARGDIFDQSLRALGIAVEAETIVEMVQAYRTHTPAIALAGDAVECLVYLRGRCKLAMITDGPVQSQESKIRSLGIEHWIPTRILTGHLGPGFSKPHPLAFRTVQERVGASGRECVYVADNPKKDFISPRQLGWTTVRIRRELGLYSQTEPGEYGADFEFDDLKPLQSILRAE